MEGVQILGWGELLIYRRDPSLERTPSNLYKDDKITSSRIRTEELRTSMNADPSDASSSQ